MFNLNENILDISNNYYNYLLSLENVHGVGLGFKVINKIQTLEPCIHVLVNKKISENYLNKNNIIPKTFMGIKTDVIENGAIRPLKEYNENKFRPLEWGCALGLGRPKNNKYIGTLCCIVTKKIFFKKKFFLLSNNHVLALVNSLPIGTPILQPTIARGANLKTDVIAHLSDFVHLKFINEYSKPINTVDAAIAELINPNLASSKIVGRSNVKGFSSVQLNDIINKVGAKTGFSSGKVITIGATIIFPYSEDENVLFQNQIRASLYNSSGDSGSGIFNDTDEIVGLLFAGSEDGKYAYFNDIDSVLKSMKLKLYID